MNERLAIVGDGLAGPALARALAEQQIQSTLIVRKDFDSERAFKAGFRVSTPLVREHVMEQLGISAPEYKPLTKVRLFAGGTELQSLSRIAMHRAGLADDPFFTPDPEQASNQLLSYAVDSPYIEILRGGVQEVCVEEGEEDSEPRLVGLKVNDEEIETSLVFDATGRRAPGVASLVVDEVPKAIDVTSNHQPTTYIGAYMHLENLESTAHFRDADTVLSGGFMPNGARIFLVPHSVKGSNATHLCFVGASKETIGQAFRAARSTNKPQDNSHALALQRLAQGTIWQEALDRIVDVDRTAYFNYRSAESRIPRIVGLAMIGDAQVHVNPTSGVGYGHIAKDIRSFLQALQRTATSQEAGQQYNAAQEQVCARRITKARRVATGVRYAGAVARTLL